MLSCNKNFHIQSLQQVKSGKDIKKISAYNALQVRKSETLKYWDHKPFKVSLKLSKQVNVWRLCLLNKFHLDQRK